MKPFRIAHMYPDLMNLYGDRGNLICLQKRLEWHGFPCEILPIRLESPFSFEDVDMVFMGGGSDREQGLVYQDFLQYSEKFCQAIDEGLPVLFICGAYQLLGKEYQSADGTVMQGLGLFDFYTTAGSDRLIGNVLIESKINGKDQTVVGFENHAGRTYLGEGLSPLGKVLKGHGNNSQDGTEGMAYKNLSGTYLHGPLLPKNPHMAESFVKLMLERRGMESSIVLDDRIEWMAHEQIKTKVLKTR